MNFRELKNGYIVYVFDRKAMTCREGRVTNISLPRFENKIGQTPCSVVDVSIDVDGKVNTYVFSDNTSKAYNGDITFAIDKGDIVTDVKAIKKATEQSIADYDKHKEIVAQCNKLLGELDTEYKEKKALEDRLTKMERMMETMINRLGGPLN